jgi:hypothetical protein
MYNQGSANIVKRYKIMREFKTNGRIRCKDYFIIKIRYYADEKLLSKCRDNMPLPQEHHDRAKEWNEFFWKFVERVTKTTQKEWRHKYLFDTRECAIEEIFELHGIFLQDNEGWENILVPISNTEIIEWIRENNKLPFKVPQKINLGSYRYRGNIETWQREHSLEMTAEMHTKYPELKNALID